MADTESMGYEFETSTASTVIPYSNWRSSNIPDDRSDRHDDEGDDV